MNEFWEYLKIQNNYNQDNLKTNWETLKESLILLKKEEEKTNFFSFLKFTLLLLIFLFFHNVLNYSFL